MRASRRKERSQRPIVKADEAREYSRDPMAQRSSVSLEKAVASEWDSHKPEQEGRKPRVFPLMLVVTRISPGQKCLALWERWQDPHYTVPVSEALHWEMALGGGNQCWPKNIQRVRLVASLAEVGGLGLAVRVTRSELELNSTDNSWRWSFSPRFLDRWQHHLGTCKAWEISATPPPDFLISNSGPGSRSLC